MCIKEIENHSITQVSIASHKLFRPYYLVYPKEKKLTDNLVNFIHFSDSFCNCKHSFFNLFQECLASTIRIIKITYIHSLTITMTHMYKPACFTQRTDSLFFMQKLLCRFTLYHIFNCICTNISTTIFIQRKKSQGYTSPFASSTIRIETIFASQITQ